MVGLTAKRRTKTNPDLSCRPGLYVTRKLIASDDRLSLPHRRGSETRASMTTPLAKNSRSSEEGSAVGTRT